MTEWYDTALVVEGPVHDMSAFASTVCGRSWPSYAEVVHDAERLYSGVDPGPRTALVAECVDQMITSGFAFGHQLPIPQGLRDVLDRRDWMRAYWGSTGEPANIRTACASTTSWSLRFESPGGVPAEWSRAAARAHPSLRIVVAGRGAQSEDMVIMSFARDRFGRITDDSPWSRRGWLRSRRRRTPLESELEAVRVLEA